MPNNFFTTTTMSRKSIVSRVKLKLLYLPAYTTLYCTLASTASLRQPSALHIDFLFFILSPKVFTA